MNLRKDHYGSVVPVGIGSDCWYVNIVVGRSVGGGGSVGVRGSSDQVIGERRDAVGWWSVCRGCRLHQAGHLSLWWLLAWLGGERWRGVVGVWLAMATDHVCLWRRAVPIYRRHLVAIVGCLWWSSVCWCCVRCRLRGGWLYDVTAAGVLPGA